MGAKFIIRAGTLVQVTKAADDALRWRDHITKRELQFARYERFNGGSYVFREGEWLILATRSKVHEPG